MTKNYVMKKKAQGVAPKDQYDVMHMVIDRVRNLENETKQNNGRLSLLEDTMRISGAQQSAIKDLGKESVLKALGGMESTAYKKLSRKVFAAMWHQFKHYFHIPRYSELPAKKYEEGIQFVKTWTPQQEMKMLIAKTNRG